MHKVFDLNLNFLNYKNALKKLVYTIIFIENKNIWPTTERESHNTIIFTTTLSSFTDGLILSVTAMKSVGENNTDGLTDVTRPSV
jgi:hypothetical protein